MKEELGVSGCDITVSIPGVDNVSLSPLVVHESNHTFLDFCNIGDVIDSCIQHVFYVRLDRELLEESAAVADVATNRHGDFWSALQVFNDGVDSVSRPSWTKTRLEIAELELYEFPVRFKEAYHNTWFMLLDAVDGDTAELGEIADGLAEKAEQEGDLVLLDGSLFVPKLLSVHPLARRNRLGIRLLAHSIWFLSRSTHDLALALAKPMGGRFSMDEPDRSAPAIRRLVRYYESVGFRRVFPRRKIVADRAVPLVAYVGQSGPSIKH